MKTLRELCAAYIADHAKPKKKTWKDDESILNRHVLPKLGFRLATSVVSGDLEPIHASVGADHPYAANRILGTYRKVVNWAKGRPALLRIRGRKSLVPCLDGGELACSGIRELQTLRSCFNPGRLICPCLIWNRSRVWSWRFAPMNSPMTDSHLDHLDCSLSELSELVECLLRERGMKPCIDWHREDWEKAWLKKPPPTDSAPRTSSARTGASEGWTPAKVVEASDPLLHRPGGSLVPRGTDLSPSTLSAGVYLHFNGD